MRKLSILARGRAQEGTSSPTVNIDNATSLNNGVKVSNRRPLSDPKRELNIGLGVRVLYEPPDPSDTTVDIVFVHGVTGNTNTTWLHEESKVYWPVDLLSQDIPHARVLAFGYDADVVKLRGSASQNRIANHASNLVGDIARSRGNLESENRRIIFVAHSLGGLVTKDALCTSKASSEKHLQRVENCTTAILFLGTPHHGSGHAALGMLGATTAKIFKRANSDIVSVLLSDSETLARIQDGFHTILRERKDDLAVSNFYEELPLPVGGMTMTKFSSRDDQGYNSILGELERCIERLKAVPGPMKKRNFIFTVPFDRDPKFVGRVDTLNKIKDQLKIRRRVALAGIGGVGKSQVAIEFCYQFRDENPDAHVLWVHCSSAARFTQAYQDIARRLELPGHDDPTKDTVRLLSEWLSEASNGAWLMILDNADNLEIFFPSKLASASEEDTSAPLIRYIPRASHGSIVITTRDKRMGERLADREAPVTLDPMDATEAKELLRSQIHSADSSNEDDLQGLLEALEFLPLAITQAAAFISENNTSLTDYLNIVRTHDSEIKDLLDEDHGDLRRDFESPSSVIKTWKLSFDLINERKPVAARILSLMAMLDRQSIPKSLLIQDNDRSIDIMTALGTLQAFFLVGMEKGGETYELHRLVQLATQRWLEMHGTKQRVQQDALLLLAKRFPYVQFSNRMQCETLMPHAEIVLERTYIDKAYKLAYAELLGNMAAYHNYQGCSDIAYSKYVTVLEVREKLLGPENEKTLQTKGDLAYTLVRQRRWNEAEELNRRRLETTIERWGWESPAAQVCKSDLADVYENIGRYAEAEDLRNSVLRMTRLIQGPEDIRTLYGAFNFASVLRRMGRIEEAEKLLLETLQTSKRLWGFDNPVAVSTMSQLALVYEYQRRWKEAETMYSDALAVCEKILPAGHPHIMASAHTLAHFYFAHGRTAEAKKLHLLSLEAWKGTFNTERPPTFLGLYMLAFDHHHHGRWDEAEKLYSEVLERQKEMFGAEDCDTLITMDSLASVYNYQDRKIEALEMMKAVVEGRTRTLGADDLTRLQSVFSLAFFHWGQGHLEEAGRLYEGVLERQKRILGAEHHTTLRTMNHLAHTYRDQHRNNEAIGLMRATLEGRLKTLGPDHKYTVESVEDLSEWVFPMADDFYTQGRLEEAEKLYEGKLKNEMLILGEEHPITLGTLNNLAAVYGSRNRIDEAIALMKKVFELKIKLVGTDHRATLASGKWLELWLDPEHFSPAPPINPHVYSLIAPTPLNSSKLVEIDSSQDTGPGSEDSLPLG
ncbi:hypothetical protein MMC30_003694 [Trapelia coarctata]|nr:hypothetical protein [Trapelia coarctata]